MPDPLTPEERSRCMAAIRQKDTQPEMIVRRAVHAMGFRYRLHKAGLPGRPDLVFAQRRRVIFVHGCFWHRHTCRNGRATPVAHRPFWRTKFRRNVARDRRIVTALRRQGWRVLVLWECQIRGWPRARLERALRCFLGKSRGGRQQGRQTNPCNG